MIPFFRKIRKQFADDNKPIQYMRYAIGEIVLVVIGILFAVQINTWNEARKANNSIESLLTVFESELEDNIRYSSRLISFGYRTDSIVSLFKEKKVTKKMLSDNRVFNRIFGTRTTDFTYDNLDQVIAQEKQLPKKYISLVPQLKELKTRIDSQKKWEDMVVNLSNEYAKERANNLEWLNQSDSKSNEKRLNYILSPININKMLHFTNLQLSENVWDASLIRTSCIALLWNIKSLRNDKQELEDFFKARRLNPWKEMDCNQKPNSIDYNVQFRTNFVIYNNTNERTEFNVINSRDGSIEAGFTVKPKSFKRSQFYIEEYEILHRVDNNGNCIKVFGQVKDGYIIIQ